MNKKEILKKETENLFFELEKMNLASGSVPTPKDLQMPKNQINSKGEQIKFPITYKIFKIEGAYAHHLFDYYLSENILKKENAIYLVSTINSLTQKLYNGNKIGAEIYLTYNEG